MKKIICLSLALVLVMSVLCVTVAADSVTASLAFDKEKINVGDEVTVTVMFSGVTSGTFYGADIAVYYNDDVLKYIPEKGIRVDKALTDAGIESIFKKGGDGIVRCAVAFTPNTLDMAPAKVGDSMAVWSATFKAVAEGDSNIQFAVKGKSPVHVASLVDGAMANFVSYSEFANIEFADTQLLVGEGKPQILISEFIGAEEVVVPVGTTAEEVIAQLPDELSVRLDNGETGMVKVAWTAGSLISGYDGNAEGEYYFTANITDSGEYVNVRNLFSTVKVIVGEKKAETTEIVMIIDSNKPVINGKAVEIDVPAMILNDRTMTPSRFVAEALGAEVSWDAEARTVTITKDETEIVLTIDSNVAVINGIETEVDVPATIIDDRTLTPARFVAEALGAEVSWDETERKVTILFAMNN